MPPRRSSATAMVAIAAATPMTAVAVEQLIEARVSAALGNKGVVVLSQWFEKMESVFHVINCTVENQVKFATCTFLGNALTWWNSHMKTVTQDVAYVMDWKVLKKIITVKYCPRGEIKKLEIELWNLKVKVEKYVGGLPDMIRGNVMSYQPKTMEKAIEFANDQMDQKVLTITEKQAEQKRKTTQNAVTCYECGVQGHFKKDCPKIKNGNRGNQHGNGNAPAKVYVVGNASNVVTGTFLLNDRYASILFDTGADRSFVSTIFSSLIDITPTTLDHYYDVELADEKIIGINTIIRGCTLNFLDHPLNINLIPVELGSFDVIIGMDWLSKYHDVIDYAEKIVRIPWGNETLIVHGDGSNQGNGTRLNIISCTKTHKYLLKGHNVFLAHVSTKETEDKSGEKRLEDVLIVQDFPEVFPKVLSGLPPTRQVEFQIDLMPGAAPVA
ncbi:putative reverse transcriptase domain-containing protein [Tanacetum coccineum]